MLQTLENSPISLQLTVLCSAEIEIAGCLFFFVDEWSLNLRTFLTSKTCCSKCSWPAQNDLNWFPIPITSDEGPKRTCTQGLVFPLKTHTLDFFTTSSCLPSRVCVCVCAPVCVCAVCVCVLLCVSVQCVYVCE